ncbi:hypothetical protein ACMAUO_06065 [Gluconacetobacter sp. Hr-1-5]|uniref:hypothetical protein n=1 Tax=Gluconacetobacter sp. Hr-1-5 TaxID=3395370 RepID=UPI003B52E9BF
MEQRVAALEAKLQEFEDDLPKLVKGIGDHINNTNSAVAELAEQMTKAFDHMSTLADRISEISNQTESNTEGIVKAMNAISDAMEKTTVLFDAVTDMRIRLR